MTEPNARDFELAYELLRPVPLNVRPIDHFARLIAEYRDRLELEELESSDAQRCEACGASPATHVSTSDEDGPLYFCDECEAKEEPCPDNQECHSKP